MNATVSIACYPSRLESATGWATVAVDVLRATTTAVTAVAAGHRCFPVASIESALPVAARLTDPLLVGELGGHMPYGFHLQNSPVEMERRRDSGRPVILLSTSGTRLLCEAAAAGTAYAACLRNARVQADWLIEHHRRVLLLAGETRGEFREEDRLCCARIARDLIGAGYAPASAFVEEIVKQWSEAPDDSFLDGHSVRYLTDTGQYHDVEFTLAHVNDLDGVYKMRDGELVQVGAG